MRRLRHLVLLAAFFAPPAHVAQHSARSDDFSGMRGANYVPSYARNDVQIWMDYDPAVIDRELGYAARLRLNTVRVFLQVAVYERDPKLFLARFEDFLARCEKHHLRMMPVVFDSCFGEFPDLEGYRKKDWMANPGQNRLGPEHWPKLKKYVRDVVGGHRGDRRIVLWDVMNEPTCTSFNQEEDRKLIWAFVRHFLDYVKEVDPTHPRTVGVMHSNELAMVQDRVDVLGFHNYRRDLREDLRAVRALGRKLGKPVVVNEVVMRPGQPFSFAMPVLAEEKVGWCFWELMLGSTQFSRGENPIQGIVYPDGTCRYAVEVAAVLNPGRAEGDPRRIAAEAGLPQRPGPEQIADTDPRAKYSEGWTAWNGDGPRFGTLHYQNRAGATAEVAFEGTSVWLVYKVGPDCGIAEILLDGKPATKSHGCELAADAAGRAPLDTYGPNVDWSHRLLLARNLRPGRHTLCVVVTGRKRPASSNTYVQIVGLDIEPTGGK